MPGLQVQTALKLTTLYSREDEEKSSCILPGQVLPRNRSFKGVVLRWWRNRTGRPLSPSQIPQNNISTLSKLHKTTSECWQRTSGNQKSRPLSSKQVGKNIKDEKRDKGGGEGAPSQEGNFKKRGFQTPGNTLPAESVVSLGNTEGNITGRKNK